LKKPLSRGLADFTHTGPGATFQTCSKCFLAERLPTRHAVLHFAVVNDGALGINGRDIWPTHIPNTSLGWSSLVARSDATDHIPDSKTAQVEIDWLGARNSSIHNGDRTLSRRARTASFMWNLAGETRKPKEPSTCICNARVTHILCTSIHTKSNSRTAHPCEGFRRFRSEFRAPPSQGRDPLSSYWPLVDPVFFSRT
jgi:hypothetical protein